MQTWGLSSSRMGWFIRSIFSAEKVGKVNYRTTLKRISPASGSSPDMEHIESLSFLVVGGDLASQEYLDYALNSLGYQATLCQNQEQALSLLYKKEHGFDIVLLDFDVPHESGFKFLEFVRFEMKLRIIVMSSVNHNELIAEGINHGASYCVLKPVSISNLQSFCHQALLHRRYLRGAGDLASSSKSFCGQNDGTNQATIVKGQYKDRIVWTDELQARFVLAVDALGGKHKAVPSKIKELMGVPDLKREHIASHLQKYRISSDPNKPAGKRKRRTSRPQISDSMQVNRIDERVTGLAHGDRPVPSFEAPEFGPDAQNVMAREIIHEAEGNLRGSTGTYADPMPVNGIDGGVTTVGHGNQQVASFMAENGSQRLLYGGTIMQPNFPVALAEPLMMQKMVVPEVAGDSCGPSLPTRSSFELHIPLDGNEGNTPSSPNPELEAFLAMDLELPGLSFSDEYTQQDMSPIFGGLPNGLDDDNYPVGQSKMGNGSQSSPKDTIGNDQEQTPEEQPWSTRRWT